MNVPQPRIFDVMGDYMLPEVLAKVAKCSQTAHDTITPILERKKRDKQEMHDLVQRLFHGIRFLPKPTEIEDASYYTNMLDAYFTRDHTNVLQLTEISHIVGRILDLLVHSRAEMVVFFLRTSLKTAEGRSRVLKAIEEWRVVVTRNVTGLYGADENHILGILEDLISNDFAVRFDFIHSQYGRYTDE